MKAAHYVYQSNNSFHKRQIGKKTFRNTSYQNNYRISCQSSDHEDILQDEVINTKQTIQNGNMEQNPLNEITELDETYMKLALEAADIGFGQTYPNPAVGCVLVRGGKEEEEEDQIIGKGFHPKAGMPHAEVFALLQASGHVDDGVTAAESVLPKHTFSTKNNGSTNLEREELAQKVQSLLAQYSAENGAHDLFDDCCKDDVTAYVTLEPCCHRGKTPPCASSLLYAGVKRVVVGFRDPNPRVDGGGVKLLRDGGVRVDYFASESRLTKKNDNKCADVVECFVKRITSPKIDYDAIMTGKKRRYLRALANQRKRDDVMAEIQLNNLKKIDDPRWMEELDAKLWKKELVVVRMNGAVKMKKECKMTGEKLAEELNAHVVQVMGRTVLIYRPGLPNIIDLNKAVSLDDDTDKNNHEEDKNDDENEIPYWSLSESD